MAARTLTPRPPEWTDTAPIKVSASREIAASAKEVFDALADHETWPEWFGALTKVERFGDLHDGIGSNRRVFIGRVQVDEEFIVWEPGKAWGFTVIGGTMPPLLESMNELVTIQEIGVDRVRVTYLMAIEPKAWSKPLVRVAAGRLRKNLGEALDNLGPHIAKGRG